MKTLHGKKCVRRAEGAVFSDVLDCIVRPEKAARLNVEGLHVLNCNHLQNVKLYTCLNESPIEHGFGILSSGDRLRGILEFAIKKRIAQTTMLQNQTETGFSQPHQYRKRYFEMTNEKKLKYKDAKKLLKDVNNQLVDAAHYKIVSAESISTGNDEDMKTVRAAMTIAKVQPRRYSSVNIIC